MRIKPMWIAMSVIAMAFSVFGMCFAQDSKEQTPPADFRRAFGQAQQEALERLQKKDPQAYQRQKAALDRQNKIQEVAGLYFEGKFPLIEAKAALSPLVKEQMQEEGVFSNLDKRIQRLEEQLAFLKKSKEQPELLVEERINQLLGRPSSGHSADVGFGLD